MAKASLAAAEQQDLPLWDEQLTTPENKQGAADQVDLGDDRIFFDGQRYHYHGLTFTVEEAGVFPDCPLERIKVMVDATYDDPARQREIARFGRRVWHSRVRPERAASQALDYALGHNVSLVARYLPYVLHVFDEDPARADAWTVDLQRAYGQHKSDREPARRLLEEVGVSSKFL
ncbi:hypothetical protein KDA_76000 [Dictyobacter alpinus]|uniref:Uncharacterized protein n=1 Tax=Dictyobacter alpinus TaxID=2014873 RepID=A0A402BLB2_9CHLR|nr:hypothetical protein [Dictyobacter alpinus]GCE32116.1 hypothetical protein KDA_76000 [Dictyobacter alpinus]